MLAENLARQKESEEDLYRLESEFQITLDPTLIPKQRKGVLSWPFDSVFVTGYFGRTSSCKIYSGSDCWHNGVDFRAKSPMLVKAMLSGVVEGTGNTDDYKGCYS